ncbi:MAG: S-layer homology domain-containing protein [Clostridia bacterium]|nr:S-layer homology domain-containing protein [Clostridia bacterium]
MRCVMNNRRDFMKKTIRKAVTFLVALSLAAGIAIPSMTASAATEDASVQQAIQAMGIITGDENGNLNLSDYVTRAQFAKMMVAASSYKDTVSSSSSSSPFKDVKYTHWAASYVRAAVSAGWVTGYTDGTFRPDNDVTLEEVVSAILKMLGYASSDFVGSFPEAQLSKYAALGLSDNISKTQGQYLSRQDCMNLFYNLMGTNTTNGSYYATTLGYSVNDSGELDYSALILSEMKGPFVVKSTAWYSALPIITGTVSVYLNGASSSLSAVSLYDVYYYNANMNKIWVYRNQVSGVYTSASPSSAAPSTVTVGGNSYSVSTSSAAYALSTVGTYKIGDTVTLLLGMKGDAVAVASAEELNITKYGFVTGTGTSTYTDTSGNTYSSDTISVACTDGSTYEYDVYSSSAFSKGNLVKVSISGGKLSITYLSTKTLSGTVNSAATALGGYAFSDDVQIMDSTDNGSFVKIYPSRLAGLNLTSGDVRYYVLNDDGEIALLILDDVTGDMYDYGVLTDVSESFSTTSVGMSGSYKYIINGASGSYSSSSKLFLVDEGPALFEFSGGSIVKLKKLTSVYLTSLNALYGTGIDGVQYSLGDGADVYIFENGDYSLSSISAVSDTSSYTLCGYYEGTVASGGRIRIIIAYAK